MEALAGPIAQRPPRAGWREAIALLGRPQPVTLPMVALLAIVPFYLVIGSAGMRGRTLHSPELAWDSLFTLQPAWSVAYGSLFLAALLPAFVVHQRELLRRTILAYLATWLASYTVFLAFPTAAPLHAQAAGNGFFDWALRTIHGSDVPANCFPSLHVAQCFLAAFACYRVHRGVGAVAGAWASLVAVSTLFTKQHYVLDVAGGALLAVVASAAFLRGYPRSATPEIERRLAPLLAAGAFATYGLMLAALWALYALGY